jgi:hypothetical protein
MKLEKFIVRTHTELLARHGIEMAKVYIGSESVSKSGTTVVYFKHTCNEDHTLFSAPIDGYCGPWYRERFEKIDESCEFKPEVEVIQHTWLEEIPNVPPVEVSLTAKTSDFYKQTAIDSACRMVISSAKRLLPSLGYCGCGEGLTLEARVTGSSPLYVNARLTCPERGAK